MRGKDLGDMIRGRRGFEGDKVKWRHINYLF